MSEYIVEARQILIARQSGKTPKLTAIVRCGDCKCFDEEKSLCDRLGKFPEWHACTEPDGYCKWAKRRQP